jgi:hypothetical protein
MLLSTNKRLLSSAFSSLLLPTAAADLESKLPDYIRNNAGKAFEFMMEACDEERKAAGLGTAEELRQVRSHQQQHSSAQPSYMHSAARCCTPFQF